MVIEFIFGMFVMCGLGGYAASNTMKMSNRNHH